jgi:pyruvate-formate lyase
VGLGTMTDCLAAIKTHVFAQKDLSMSDLLSALQANFEGFAELHHTLVHHSPKYGNDDDQADSVMRDVFEAYFQAVDGRPNTKGGCYRINLLPTTVHVYFGAVMGASADGRKAGIPLSEGISPVQGADRQGPTAVLKSAAKMDHGRTGGTLLNVKFNPQVLATDDDLDKLVQLIRSYFRLDGHHIQFNVINKQTLLKAQQHPEQYQDLIVRVAGYSDYFTDLGLSLQNEIIARTEQMTL